MTLIEQDLHSSRPDSYLEPLVLVEESDPTVSVGLITLLTNLIKRRFLIGCITGLATIGGIAISLLLPVRYTATTRILTPQQTQSSAAMMMSQLMSSNAASLVSASAGGFALRNPNDLYIGLLQSRPIADAIVAQFALNDIYRAKSMSSTRKHLASYTSVTSEKSGFIEISVTDRDKTRAAQLANAYTDQLRVLTKGLAVTEASRRRLFYEGELKRAKEDLIAAAVNFQQIQQKRGLVQLDAQAKALIAGIAELHSQVATKEVQLHALRSYSTEKNPEVQLTEDQLSSLKEQVGHLENARHTPETVSGMGLQDVAGAGSEYLRAEHELQYRQALLDLMTKQYEAARLDEAKDAAIIQIVETAVPPEEKSSPHRSQIVLVCLALGFVCGCLYVTLGTLVRRELYLLRFMNQQTRHLTEAPRGVR
jgi:tyrosine-protein kinase Etk/Wzc